MNLLKTMIEDNEPIRCQHCPAVTEQVVDRARASGWRVYDTWRVCPECWDEGGRRISRWTPQEYDIPMF